MEIIEKLLERINEYIQKMNNEKNMSTKMSYLDELMQVGKITKELHCIVCTSILNVDKK